MATILTSAQIPEPFCGLLSPVKVVQDTIEERTENKVSLLEGRAGVTLYPDNPPLSSGVRHSLNQQLHGFERVLLHREDAVCGQ